MNVLNWTSSWLPSQLFGIKSLILYGLCVSARPAESLCAADCIQSAVDWRVHLFTDSLQRVCHLLSDLLLQRHQVCCGGNTCFLPCECCCCRGSRGLPSDFACDGALPRSATMPSLCAQADYDYHCDLALLHQFFNFRITHLDLLQQISNFWSVLQFSSFSNFSVDLQVIRHPFTAGEHSQR